MNPRESAKSAFIRVHCLLRSFRRRFADAAKTNCIAGQACVGEAWRLTEPVRRSQSICRRFPGAATQDILLAVSWSTRVLLGTVLVVGLVVGILAPLGDVAVHVEQAPGVGLLLADGMRLLGAIVAEPGV